MKVSVIVPTHNRVSLLKRSILSVLSQRFTDFECVIVDDHSTDGTEEFVKNFEKTDARIRYIKHKGKRNLQAVLNTGLSSAKGEYIARIDDDDYWLDIDKLKKQINFLDKHRDYVLVGTNACFFYDETKILFSSGVPLSDKKIRQFSLLQNNFLSSTVVFRKQLALSVGGFSEEVGLAGDYALWLGLGKTGKVCNLADVSTAIYLPESHVKNRRIIRVKDSIFISKCFKKDYPLYNWGKILRLLTLIYLYVFPQVLFIDKILIKSKVRLFHNNRV